MTSISAVAPILVSKTIFLGEFECFVPFLCVFGPMKKFPVRKGAPTISLKGEKMSVAARSARSQASHSGTTCSNILSIDLSGVCNHTTMEQQIFMLQAENARLLQRVGSLEHELAAEKVETRVVKEQLSLVKHMLGNGQIASSLSAALPNSSNFISGRPQQFLSCSRTDLQHKSSWCPSFF